MILFSNRATEFTLPAPVGADVSLVPGFIAAGVIFVIAVVTFALSVRDKKLADEKPKDIFLSIVLICLAPFVAGCLTTLVLREDNEFEAREKTNLALEKSLAANYGVELPDTDEYIYDYTAAAGDQAGDSFAVLDDGAKYECELFIFNSKTYSVYCGENADKVALETLVN